VLKLRGRAICHPLDAANRPVQHRETGSATDSPERFSQGAGARPTGSGMSSGWQTPRALA